MRKIMKQGFCLFLVSVLLAGLVPYAFAKENAMRKIMKRGFCLFLVAVLLAGLVPYAFADETEPTETAEASEAARTANPPTTSGRTWQLCS